MFKKIILLICILTSEKVLSQPYKKNYEVIISTNGFHTSIILPVKNTVFDWSKELYIDEKYKYLEFGWGNDRFYMHKGGFPVLIALNAVSHPTPTVLHVVYLNRHPSEWFKNPRFKTIYLDSANFCNISRYIVNSFALKNGLKIYRGEGLYGPSEFYTATGNYSLFKTCNTWVAYGLRKAGIKTGIMPITAWGVMRRLKNNSVNN